MGQSYGLNKENKGKIDSALDFPRLKLEKKGQKARIALFGITEVDGKKKISIPEPEGGYYFDLRIPGHEREFQGAYECLASEDVKAEGGLDPDACPHCEIALKGEVSEEVMGPRKRRFVLPVVLYKTKSGSSELVKPYSVEVLAWKFTDRYFNVLVDEHEKWAESGGLLGHDITLTCEVPQYQTFTVSVEPNAAYKEDPELGKLVIETFLSQTGTLTDGLIRQLGQTLNKVDLEKKIRDTVQGAAQLGIGATIQDMDPASVEDLAADLLGSGGTTTEASDVTVETAEPVTVSADDSSDSGIDFDDFFSS